MTGFLACGLWHSLISSILGSPWGYYGCFTQMTLPENHRAVWKWPHYVCFGLFGKRGTNESLLWVACLQIKGSIKSWSTCCRFQVLFIYKHVGSFLSLSNSNSFNLFIEQFPYWHGQFDSIPCWHLVTICFFLRFMF